MTCGCADPASVAWFLASPSYALTHGHSLFFTTRVHVPGGMNLLDNGSVLALGFVLAPVTWLSGPVATLNVALTLAPALTALSAYAALRGGLKLGWPAAFAGGLGFGFSPYMLRTDAVAHLHLSFLALLPLIFWCCYELAVTQRGRWWRWGLGLGLLATAQFFVGVEMLTITVLVTLLAVLLTMVAAAIRRPAALSARIPYAWRGFLLAAAIAAVLLAYPLWFALAGPGHIRGADWASPTSNGLLRVLLPLAQSRHYQQDVLPRIGYLGPGGTLQGYLGIAALVLLAVAVFAVRRPLPKLCAAVTLISVWLSLGATTEPLSGGGEPSALWLPWRILGHLPVLDKVGPGNFSAEAAWFTVVAAALLVDRLWQADTGQPGVRARPLPARALAARRAGAAAASAALVLPWLLSWHLPYTTETVTTPAWVTRAATRLPADAVVLFYPFPASYEDQALIWQAGQGMRYAVVGGRGIVADSHGNADHGTTPGTPEGTMSALSVPVASNGHLRLPAQPDAAAIRSFRAALRHWGVTTVVMTGGGRAPAYSRRWLTAVLGVPPHREYGSWAWNQVQQLIKG